MKLIETSNDAGKLTYLDAKLLRAVRKLSAAEQDDLAAIAEAWQQLKPQISQPALRLVKGDVK